MKKDQEEVTIHKVRLQKFIAECGVTSRRKAEELIIDSKVRVNGRFVTELGTKIDPYNDIVKVKEKLVIPPHKGVFILHKPRGVLTTLDTEERRPTVLEYLTKKTKSYYPVGRLDADSSGLLIFTNDGDLAAFLTHPRYGAERVYEVKVRGVMGELSLKRLERGVQLEDGYARCKELKVIEELETSTWLEITVTEGRNRMVRRMCEAVGHTVLKLVRTRHGKVLLGNLKVGEIKTFTEREYQQLKRDTNF
jgi:pseudouridine synthase